MTLRALAALVLSLLALGATALAVDGDSDAPSEAPLGLTCTAPTDARALETLLTGAGSPMAPWAESLVAAASAVDLDPRAVVAIAAHETLLATYRPSQEINNPFGLGPGWAFDDNGAAIERAIAVLDRYYLAEGRDTIATIGPKWAPIGADNDPDGLNNHWVAGVSVYYRALGGDADLPLRLSAQAATPPCTGANDHPGAAAVVTLWNPEVVPAAGPRMSQGGDPTTGAAALPDAFAFPLAPGPDDEVLYANPIADQRSCVEHPSGCTITLVSRSGVDVVAATSGTLAVADGAEQAAGIGFWIEGDGGDRFGYAPLVSYAERLHAGATVRVGDRLGVGNGALRVAWQRDGIPINPFPLLHATRPAG